ncbi:TetR/AcrR family transcriptional regulator [Rhodococcus sp. HNM0569]|uniref:TetR/AcrR family transcriptional regulator n=1 Tax=Rhodococcus sp. HNM0569 TaxID=2716340 RepID=UPI00146F8F97|nr:TetR/AcrR family transcriptional regulator [Rhodococcus sp. HNM0569]NLU83253.1 TetR/AcrR family transcriptional regulator [Rhodococcus sp. HNM0569]
MADAAVPAFIQRLWRLPTTPPRRGRKSALTVESVVGTAVRLADNGGLDAATLPKVAEELDVTAMSLYRYVGSKHELLQLMMDAASEPRIPERTASGWREGLHLWAVDLWILYRSRPWLPRVPIYRAPSGPHQIAWLERGFTQLAATDLDWKEKLAALTLLSGYVRQSALLQRELEEGREPNQAQADSEREYGAALRLVVTSEEFPQTAAMLASQVLGNDSAGDDDPDQGFLEGLELVLDGLAAQIADPD